MILLITLQLLNFKTLHSIYIFRISYQAYPWRLGVALYLLKTQLLYALHQFQEYPRIPLYDESEQIKQNNESFDCITDVKVSSL